MEIIKTQELGCHSGEASKGRCITQKGDLLLLGNYLIQKESDLKEFIKTPALGCHSNTAESDLIATQVRHPGQEYY